MPKKLSKMSLKCMLEMLIVKKVPFNQNLNFCYYMCSGCNFFVLYSIVLKTDRNNWFFPITSHFFPFLFFSVQKSIRASMFVCLCINLDISCSLEISLYFFEVKYSKQEFTHLNFFELFNSLQRLYHSHNKKIK